MVHTLQGDEEVGRRWGRRRKKEKKRDGRRGEEREEGKEEDDILFVVRYHIAGNFRLVQIFVIFIVWRLAMKLKTNENKNSR